MESIFIIEKIIQMFFGLLHFAFSSQSFNKILPNNSPFIKDEGLEYYYNKSFSSRFLTNNAIWLICCTFNLLKSESNGGAISINLRSRLNVKNFIDQCSFIGCHSQYGGAIYINIENNFITEIQNSIYKHNYADTSSGGAIYIISKIRCNFTFKNCSFNNNSAHEKGGSIYYTKINFQFENCIFNSNKLSGSSRSFGGAIHSQNSEGLLMNCTFTSNMINISDHDSFGGAISFSDSIGSVKKCKFIGNLVCSHIKYSFYESYFAYGGAISICSLSNTQVSFIKSLIECSFENNIVSSSKNSYGGALYLSNSYDTQNCTFYNSTFINNTVYSKSHISCGGAIDISSSFESANNTFIKLVFINNTAYSESCSSYGGAISYIYSLLSNSYIQTLFNDCIFTNNNAYSNEGGAIKISGMICLFKDCSFTNNTSCNGGAICSYNCKLKFTMCKFSNNTGFGCSIEKGGAIFSSGSIIEIKKSIFDNNKLLYDEQKIVCYMKGGCCYFADTFAFILDCNFINNEVIVRESENSIYLNAIIYGGAIYSNGTIHSLSCINCLFNNNFVCIPDHEENEFSGAIFLTNGILNSCTFIDNSAYNGCDIKYDQYENSSLSIIQCNFKHNMNEKHQIKSLIHFGVIFNQSSTNVFTRNKIVINILASLFDGRIEPATAAFKFQFKDNCISPYDKRYYKTNTINIYNENGKELLTFESAFKSVCKEYIFTNAHKGLKKITILSITIISILIVLSLLVIGLFISIALKRILRNDVIEPLIDLS